MTDGKEPIDVFYRHYRAVQEGLVWLGYMWAHNRRRYLFPITSTAAEDYFTTHYPPVMEQAYKLCNVLFDPIVLTDDWIQDNCKAMFKIGVLRFEIQRNRAMNN